MSTEQSQNPMRSFGVLLSSAPPAAPDTPVLHLDRDTLDQAMEQNQTLWYYSDTTGWLQLQFSEPAAETPAPAPGLTEIAVHFRDGSAVSYRVNTDELGQLHYHWSQGKSHITFSAYRRTTTAALSNGGETCRVFLRLDDISYID
jgi:hypothetical protein